MYLVYCRKDWTLVQACLRRIWDSQKSYAVERAPAPRREGGPYGFRGTGDQPTHRSHSSMPHCLFVEFYKTFTEFFMEEVCVITAEISVFDLGIMRIWGRNEVAVRMWLYLEVGVSVWLAAEPLNRILANRNINLTDAIKIFVTFKCLLKICTYVH